MEMSNFGLYDVRESAVSTTAGCRGQSQSTPFKHARSNHVEASGDISTWRLPRCHLPSSFHLKVRADCLVVSIAEGAPGTHSSSSKHHSRIESLVDQRRRVYLSLIQLHGIASSFALISYNYSLLHGIIYSLITPTCTRNCGGGVCLLLQGMNPRLDGR